MYPNPKNEHAKDNTATVQIIVTGDLVMANLSVRIFCVTENSAEYWLVTTANRTTRKVIGLSDTANIGIV